MAVSTYFGLTESGKSYHVENHVIPTWKRVIIFDNAACFKGEVYNQPSDKEFIKILDKHWGDKSYRITIRPGRSGDAETLFNKTVHLAIALGRSLSWSRVEPEKRVQLITDEADFVCSSHYQSSELKHLVNKGRHDNVDSHFIARVPMQIHPDIRRNTSKIVTFRLQNAGEIPLFKDNFGSILARKIKELPKYWRLEWKDNGEVAVYDEKNKKAEKFLRTSGEFLQEKRAA